ncbi:MAG: hypothetical protein P9L90_04155, partial [Candidatus Aadella gelida]|nr:hypothetical protein [Candidatus Aadella gelida]
AEAGIEKARTQLKTGWTNTSTITGTAYTVYIYTTDEGGADLPSEFKRIRSTGNVNNAGRTIEEVFRHPVALLAEGDVKLTPNVEVSPLPLSYSALSFLDTFGVIKAQMETIAEDSGTHYAEEEPFNNDSVSGITWVNVPDGDEAQITNANGGGILVIIGDLKITGGSFNGMLWVEGDFRISGNPVINGTIFVKSGVTADTSITGTAKITFDSDVISDTLGILGVTPSAVPYWKEI